MTDSTGSNTIVYCHGLPGSSAELHFLKPEDIKPLYILGPQDIDHFQTKISDNSNDNLHVIGFSLGAMAAITLATNNPSSVSKLSLISPAAPLELGNFLPKMAGRIVFQTAMRSALLFRVLTVLQKTGLFISRDHTIQTIFKQSPESDLALLSEPAFKDALGAGFKESYGKNNLAYRQAIADYVNPWADCLASITCPVSIYHGTADNWAPVEMTHALQNEIRSGVVVTEYPGLGHFSTLRKALSVAMTQ